MTAKARKDEDTAIIKKYPNRRLYNTETSTYITLDDLCDMVKAGRNFEVHDAKTGEDLTHQVLTQIIVEQESKGDSVFPTDFLRQAIRFYDHGMREAMHHYLDASMNTFVENQDKMQSAMDKTMRGISSPLGSFEEITRQNMALFEKTFQMFTPFSGMFSEGEERRKKK